MLWNIFLNISYMITSNGYIKIYLINLLFFVIDNISSSSSVFCLFCVFLIFLFGYNFKLPEICKNGTKNTQIAFTYTHLLTSCHISSIICFMLGGKLFLYQLRSDGVVGTCELTDNSQIHKRKDKIYLYRGGSSQNSLHSP